MPSRPVYRRICGIVASPTPTMPISSDSINSISTRPFKKPGQRGRSHPAGGAAADDDYFPDGFVVQSFGPRKKKAPAQDHTGTGARATVNRNFFQE